MDEKKKTIPRRSITITPAFDTSTYTWFVDEFPGVEAPTLCELLKKLPSGVKLTNYYPKGAPRQKLKRAGDMTTVMHAVGYHKNNWR